MTTEPRVQERECPSCHVQIVPVPIAYGYPGVELIELAEAGRVRLEGCMVGPESPDLACPACDAQLPWSADDGHAGR